jgi:uncharacterized metal-binding protein YceD (DUF177 family)
MPLEWTETIADVPDKGLERVRQATAAECARVGEELGLLACARIDARYRVQARGKDHYMLIGTVEADVTQECVVTVEPIEAHLSFPIEVAFVPDAEALASDMVDPFADVEYESIENNRLAVGRVIVEELASRLDPYPRRPESEFDWKDPVDAAKTGPFAALEKLKRPT